MVAKARARRQASGDAVGQANQGQADAKQQADGRADHGAASAEVRENGRASVGMEGPFVDGYFMKKAEKVRGSKRNEVIRTWSRRSTIIPHPLA